MKPFESPRSTLGGLEPEQAAALIAATADVALVVDSAGIIRDVAFGSDELSSEGYSRWLGQPWVDTVTPESRPKVEALLRDAGTSNASKWRHVNHPSSHGADVPVMYSAVQVGNKDRVVAIGRDLRAVASLQSRLVEAQQSMERDYWRLRQVETRYRLLFQMASEAVLIVDAASEKVAEANPAAAQLLGENVNRIVGRSFADCFDRRSGQAVDAVLASIRASGRAEDVRLRLAEPGGDCIVGGTLFRHDKSSSFLIRLTVPHVDPASSADQKARASLLVAVEGSPDAFVVTDMQGRVITANAAFYELVEVLTEQHARGVSLDQWLGRPGVDLNVLLTNLRQHGSVRLFATTIKGENGVVSEVEITAVAAPSADPPCLGFSIRNVEKRLAWEGGGTRRDVPRSVEQLKELVGRVPLRDIVRDTTDVIERLCIEAALDLTRDNRALAAEMLGLSRQSLYVKLRRFGMGDLGGNEPEE